MKVYTKGQEEKYHYDKHDYEFCGTAAPPVVKTEGPRLVLLFKVRKSFILQQFHSILTIFLIEMNEFL